jgi:hypothetical protein
MTLYVVSAIEIDESGRIIAVAGAEIGANGEPSEPAVEVPVEQILYALQRGDEVRAVFSPDEDIHTARRIEVIADGPNVIELEHGTPQRSLKDLPPIRSSRSD